MKAVHRLPSRLPRRLVLGFAASAGALALAGCNTAPRQFREKLTLTVATPEGTVSGSSVIEHDIAFQDGWLGGMAGHSLVRSTRGEAAVVDLGARGLLFALLIRDETRKQSTNRGIIEYTTFASLEREAQSDARGNYSKGIAYFVDSLNRLRPESDVPIETLPLLVRFRDPQAPESVEWVEPFDLAAKFGAGVKLARAAIEITNGPPTRAIEATLPWLAGNPLEPGLLLANGPLLAGTTIHYSTALKRYAFTTDAQFIPY